MYTLLIVMVAATGVGSVQIPFDTQQLCEVAAYNVKAELERSRPLTRYAVTMCVRTK